MGKSPVKGNGENCNTCSDSDDIILMSSRYVGELLEHSLSNPNMVKKQENCPHFDHT